MPGSKKPDSENQDSLPSTPQTLEIPTDASKNVEITKYYTFNETGNIMMSTTIGGSAEIEESVRKVFAEVSVFFAAMSKAISSQNLSLYNYNALEKIINGSGCFIRVTEEDIQHKTSSFGADFSKELIQGLLGLATGVGALNFAQAMISSIGKEGLSVSGSSDKSKSKIGNIVFVCEYLMGMPTVSAIVVYLDLEQNKKTIQVGPCLKAAKTDSTLIMHKDTYMFVTPTFIHEYAGDLTSIGSDAAYGDLIKSMKRYLEAG